MITIERDRLGHFKIKAKEKGLGTLTTTANDIENLKMAVEHYYGDVWHNLPLPACPFCRDIENKALERSFRPER